MTPPPATPSVPLAFGPLTFDPATGELRRDGSIVPLRPKATVVLTALIEARGHLVTHETLVARAWPDTVLETEPALHTAIRQIRRALSDSASQPTYIETVHRRGYRFIPKVSVAVPRPRRIPIQRRLAFAVILVLVVVAASLGGMFTRPNPSPEPPELTRALYLVARGSDRDVHRAVTILEPMTRRRHQSPRVWSALAAAHAHLRRYDDAEWAARRALVLSPRSAEAYRVLGEVAMHRDRDWLTAEQRFLEALDLDPRNALAHSGYAFLLALTGSPEESVREARRAIALDPLSALINGDAAVLFFWAGRHEEAERQALRTLEIEPSYRPALTYLRLARQMQGDDTGARAVAVQLLRAARAPDTVITRAAAGTATDGLLVFREWTVARTENRLSATDPNTWVWHGLALAELGRTEASTAVLAHARDLGATMWRRS